MTTTEAGGNEASDTRVARADMKLEVVVLSVSDVDRSKQFYQRLGWRLDADFDLGEGLRIVQFTPPGSGCSIAFGSGVTAGAPGAAEALELIVADIVAARAELVGHGVEVSEVFHGSPFNPARRLSGPDPDRTSYRSYASFSDPDGNGFLLQEVTTRLPGRIDTGETTFASVSDLAAALRRAEAAHGEHEKRTGQRDADWPTWYATYMAAEQSGADLPT